MPFPKHLFHFRALGRKFSLLTNNRRTFRGHEVLPVRQRVVWFWRWLLLVEPCERALEF